MHVKPFLKIVFSFVRGKGLKFKESFLTQETKQCKRQNKTLLQVSVLTLSSHAAFVLMIVPEIYALQHFYLLLIMYKVKANNAVSE